MNTKVLAIGFLASAGWGHGAHTWANVRQRARAMLVAARTRRLLAEMNDHELRDIGIGPAEARAEAARWPWDLTPPREVGRW